MEKNIMKVSEKPDCEADDDVENDDTISVEEYDRAIASAMARVAALDMTDPLRLLACLSLLTTHVEEAMNERKGEEHDRQQHVPHTYNA
jgi:hypothetical protein